MTNQTKIFFTPVQEREFVQRCASVVSKYPNIDWKMTTPIVGRELQLNEELWFAETFSKMSVPTADRHLQLKKQLSLAETDDHFEGAIGCFCLLFQKHDTSVNSEAKVECKLVLNNGHGDDYETYPECGPDQ